MNDCLAASRVLFVLGAGASVPLGMPTTKSLLEALCDSTPEGSIATEVRQSAAYRFRIAKDAVNIEDFLEHLYELQTLLWLSQRSLLPELLPNFTANSPVLAAADQKLKSLQRCVYQLLHQRCGDCSGTKVGNLWKPFLGYVSSLQPVIPIFTLNYDWTFEKLAIETMNHCQLIDGFEVLGGEWDAGRFKNLEPIADKVNIALFKLHGSTNWLPGGPVKSMGSFDGEMDSQDSFPPRRFEMVYPGHEHECWFGKESYGRLNSLDGMFQPWSESEPYKTLHAYLRDLTRQVDLIVVIGYAFHDDRVNSEIIGAVNASGRVKVLVVDPGVEGLGDGTAPLVAPFQRLTYGGPVECEWSRFEWLEGRFGDQYVAAELLRSISTLCSKVSS